MAFRRGGRIGAVMYYAKPIMLLKFLKTKSSGQLMKVIMVGKDGE